MLNKERHHNHIASFLQETLSKINYQKHNNQDEIGDTLRIWLAPNHKMLDLTAVEADDMLVVGTEAQLYAS